LSSKTRGFDLVCRNLTLSAMTLRRGTAILRVQDMLGETSGVSSPHYRNQQSSKVGNEWFLSLNEKLRSTINTLIFVRGVT
jgi:hypothetical protein